MCAGVEATLRTLVICSFRAPRSRLMFQLLTRYNPTASLLRMKSFVARHDYVFSLLLILNVNMDAFDISEYGMDDPADDDAELDAAPYLALGASRLQYFRNRCMGLPADRFVAHGVFGVRTFARFLDDGQRCCTRWRRCSR
jgi:hypothetical protein